MSNIGIIGAGQIGSAFATALANNNIAAIIANSRGPASLQKLQQSLEPFITPVERLDAAKQDVVLVAVPWSKLKSAIGDIDFEGRIIIDANNPIEAPTFRAAELHGLTSSRVVANLAKGARVVKAFNHLPPHLLTDNPKKSGGRRVLFLSGDDAAAKRTVSALIERLGFFPVDLGSLDQGGALAQFPGGPLPVHEFVQFGGR